MKMRLLLVALVLLVANAAAQKRMTTADVPTEFMVNNTLLPAGHYSIETSSDFRRDTLIIRNTESGEAVLVPVRSVPLEQKKTCGENNLTYTQKDGRRVLHQVCFAGAGYTFDLLHGSEVEEPATRP